MNDFICITKDDVLPRLMNKEDVYAFGFIISSKGTASPFVKRLKNECLGNIANIINGNNVVFYAKTQ